MFWHLYFTWKNAETLDSNLKNTEQLDLTLFLPVDLFEIFVFLASVIYFTQMGMVFFKQIGSWRIWLGMFFLKISVG